MNAHPASRTYTGIVCPTCTNEYGIVSDMVLACPGERDIRIRMDQAGRELARAVLTRGKASMVRVHGNFESSADGGAGAHAYLHVQQFEVMFVTGSDEPFNSNPAQEVME
ncbi:MAG: hypothetical protein ACOCWR_04430 [Oceanidesulfovibrio sp.]